MKTKVIHGVKIIAILAYAGVLFCIAADTDTSVQLVCCAAAAVCSYIVIFSKKK